MPINLLKDMKYRVKLKPRAEKELNKLPQRDYYRIITALVGLAIDPFVGKKLEGKYKDCYSLRVWPYRIIYQINKKELLVFVIQIGHRQRIYR